MKATPESRFIKKNHQQMTEASASVCLILATALAGQILLIMLQFITFGRLRVIAGAINFNNKGLIPSSPVATFDGSDLMISKTSRSEIVVMLNSAELPALLRLTKSTKLVRSGSVLMVLSMMLSAIEMKCSLNTLDISQFRGSIAGSVFGYRAFYSTQLSYISGENVL